MIKKTPPYIHFLLKIFLSTLLIYFILRVLLYFIVINTWSEPANYSTLDLLHAFINGLRFDVVVISYITIIPFIILGLSDLLKIRSKFIFHFITIYFIIAISISILIICADIPFFLQHYSRLNTSVMAWIDDSSYMLKMIFQEFSFYIYFILFLLIVVLIIIFILKQKRKFIQQIHEVNKIRASLIYFVLILVLLVLGIRGRLSTKSPIRTGTAYFCDNSFMNQLGLNPVFTLVSSYIKDRSESGVKVRLMQTGDAKKYARTFLGISGGDSLNSPILRYENNGNDSNFKNVVIIIMEGMSSFNLGSYGGPANLTPALKNLISRSYYFNNIYSAGIHTFNGIYSTLLSYPALFKQQPLELLQSIPHDGLANILKKKQYTTMFFTNHDAQFDNMEGFLRANGFDQVLSESDYPSDWHRNANGVPDHLMFEFAINKINEEVKKSDPFLSVLMTTSNHKPYYLPKEISFKPNSENEDYQMIEYADWSIGNFMSNAEKQSWYKNTIFVFIGDHGVNLGHTYDMPLSYHHTPLIYFSPAFSDSSRVYDCLGGQIDVVPTLLGLLNISFENNTMGVDLIKFKRPFIYFCADDKIGCLDDKYYLIIRDNGIETMYQYNELNTKNFIDILPLKIDSMKKYTFSMMQTTQWLIDHNKLKVP